MRTTFDAVDIIYNYLVNSPVKAAINGDVYKFGDRPINSSKEDIVIGSLPINNEDVQQAVLNVNIHVPNIKVKINGLDNDKPDTARLSAITFLVMEQLKEYYSGDYWFILQQQNLFEDENTNEHYVNIRINFYSYNK